MRDEPVSSVTSIRKRFMRVLNPLCKEEVPVDVHLTLCSTELTHISEQCECKLCHFSRTERIFAINFGSLCLMQPTQTLFCLKFSLLSSVPFYISAKLLLGFMRFYVEIKI